MISPRRARELAVLVATLVAAAGVMACDNPPSPGDRPAPRATSVVSVTATATGAPQPARSIATPAKPPPSGPLPSGLYAVEAKSIADGCAPKQTVEGRFELFVRGHLGASEPYVNAPMTAADGGPVRRIDLPLRGGETTRNTLKAHPPAGAATTTFETTMTEVRADGFTLRVVQIWEGLDRDPAGGDPGGAGAKAPKASCRAEQELRFTLTKELCPARCAMDGQVLPDGGVGGTCVCSDGGTSR